MRIYAHICTYDVPRLKHDIDVELWGMLIPQSLQMAPICQTDVDRFRVVLRRRGDASRAVMQLPGKASLLRNPQLVDGKHPVSHDIYSVS